MAHIDLNSLMISPGGYEVAWDYCLENNLILPDIGNVCCERGLLLLQRYSSSGDVYWRTVFFSSMPEYHRSYSVDVKGSVTHRGARSASGTDSYLCMGVIYDGY